MKPEIAYSIASIQQTISILETSIPNDRHGRSCVVQALQDLDQALDFLEDIDHIKKKLERCDGFEDDFFYCEEKW